MSQPLRGLLASSLALLVLGSCGLVPARLATVWTDVPEIAIYAELFNLDQERYRIEVVWKAELARELRDARDAPDLAIGRYLKSSIVRDRFQSLDYLFGELTVHQSDFYPGLLALGKAGGQQILLPLSFNLPALIFREDGEARPADPRTLGLDELAASATAFDRKQGALWTRMGFSPRWDADFLVLATTASGAAFREGKPLDWSETGLRQAIDRLRLWSAPTGPSANAADDFQFKYLYTPPYTYIVEGRALYAYQSSAGLFLVPESKAALLDYRWFIEGSSIPVLEDSVYAGMPKGAADRRSAEAFLGWLFDGTRQQAMLEYARRTRTLESSFGIAGGFSALRTVVEKVFPLYYASLKGHIPPAESIAAPPALPVEWQALKDEVLESWLRETLAKPQDREAGYGPELAGRIADYLKGGHNR